ncbi:hypothetical protein AcW1_000104 [Taiwanofungus camphoratus]|nr:hypothetical protein AcW2_001403 [Antrodia cinnamomea]KAI0935628.1 hypothetical protein AcV5_003998 [Antrodia cinnamomea]KAI0960855.1 hypothetical protein AcV7_000119 [Antrodia cinnamomea]KAI0962851.1 hypothetical protein AcW1_000104 [Antrodia cinnamomea]
MSLLQDVLRTQTLDSLDRQLVSASDREFRSPSGRSTPQADRDSDDELVGVVSIPGTPVSSSRPSSRPASPAPGSRPVRKPHHLLTSSRPVSSDPLRALQTEISQRIFSLLSIKDLANCSRVSRKWNKSQTLNYVWFQHYRKENFHDESLPPGKWTKRESKQSWRTTYLQTVATRSPPLGPFNANSRSNRSSLPGSGYQTPREVKEEQWRLEAEEAQRLSKVEMREMYKELGGRKPRNKAKVGAPGRPRDRGGWADPGGGEDGW